MIKLNNDYSAQEVLNYLVNCGTLNLADVCHQMDMNNDRKYLDMHENKIWQRKDGAYCTHLPDEKRKLIVRKEQADLEKAIIKYYKTIEDRPTVKTVFYKWLEDKIKYNEIKTATYDRYVNDFMRFFNGTNLINMQISKLSEDDLEDFIRTSIAEHNLSYKSYSSLKTIITGMFKFAKKKKYTNISISYFFSDLDIPKNVFKSCKKAPEEQVFSEDEIPLVIEYLLKHPTIENLAILLVLYIGARTGELVALKFSDVTGRELHIQRQEIIYKSETAHKDIHEIVEYTKSDAGDRNIILTEEALTIIKMIRKLNPFGEFMIMKNNKRISKNRFNEKLYHVCDELGIPRRSMHKLRKTYATKLINSKKVDEAIIVEQMGHSEIATTKEYYYFQNKNKENKRKQIEAALDYPINFALDYPIDFTLDYPVNFAVNE
ncbi:MAG: site-specific integrase [Lachnospiraceae bacterium]|nr:site-specific integrase [Lachnospiraceae bacterium]